MSGIRIEVLKNLNKAGVINAFNLNTSLNMSESKKFTNRLLSEGVIELEIGRLFNVIGLLQALSSANAKVEFTE